MKLTPINQLPSTVNAMLKSHGEAFYTWQAENVESGSYSRNSDRRDRFSRCHDAAEDGADGSTHAENIDDFREFGKTLFADALRASWRHDWPSDAEADAYEAVLEAAQTAYEADCDKLEAWHKANGTLDEQVG